MAAAGVSSPPPSGGKGKRTARPAVAKGKICSPPTTCATPTKGDLRIDNPDDAEALQALGRAPVGDAAARALVRGGLLDDTGTVFTVGGAYHPRCLPGRRGRRGGGGD